MERSLLSWPLALVLAVAGGAGPACIETGAEVCASGFTCPLGDRCVDIGRDRPLCVLGADAPCRFAWPDGRELQIPCEAGRACDADAKDCVSVNQYEACQQTVGDTLVVLDGLEPCQVAGYGPGSLFCRTGVCTALSCGDGFPNPAAGEMCDPRSEDGCNLYCQAPTPVALDLLFVIDTSESTSRCMELAQEYLAASLAYFLKRLYTAIDLDVDVHLGVTTTDASEYCANAICTGAGGEFYTTHDTGFFRDAQPIHCGATLGEDGLCHGDGCGDPTANCQDDLAELDPNVTACPRCRYPQNNLTRVEEFTADITGGVRRHPLYWRVNGRYSEPLASLITAVRPETSPGFRRPGALLAVVVLTDNDDCTGGHQAFGGTPREASPSRRCFAEGMACQGPNPAPEGGLTYTGCVPRLAGALADGDPAALAEAFVAAVDADAPQLGLHLEIIAGIPAPTGDATVHVTEDQRITPVCTHDANPAEPGDEIAAEPGHRLRWFLEALRELRGGDETEVGMASLCGSTEGTPQLEYQAVLDRILARVRDASWR